MDTHYYLSTLIWLPIIIGFLLVFVKDNMAQLAKVVALITSVIVFAYSLYVDAQFVQSSAQMQFVENYSWIERFNINYHLGVDGISMPLIVLTTFISILVVLAGWEVIKDRPQHYMAAFLIMEGLVIGVFALLIWFYFMLFGRHP